MNRRKQLFVACSTLNKLRLTNKIEFHGLVPEDVIYNFIEAIEDIDDRGRIERVPEDIVDFYEELVDWEEDQEGEIADLFHNTKPLYEKSHRRGRKRKYQYLINRNDPDRYSSREERERIIQRPLGRKLDV